MKHAQITGKMSAEDNYLNLWLAMTYTDFLVWICPPLRRVFFFIENWINFGRVFVQTPTIYTIRSYWQSSYIYTVSGEKRDQQYSVQNSDKFKCIIVTFGKQCFQSYAKLTVQSLSASPIQCCHFTLPNK